MIWLEQNLSVFCLPDAVRLCAHHSTIPGAFVLCSKRLCSQPSKMLCSQRSVVLRVWVWQLFARLTSSLSWLHERGWRPLRRLACVTTPCAPLQPSPSRSSSNVHTHFSDLDSLKTRAHKIMWEPLSFMILPCTRDLFVSWRGIGRGEKRLRNQTAVLLSPSSANF